MNLAARLGLDQESQLRAADILAVAVAVSLPWSTTATGILVALWLLAFLSTAKFAELRRDLTTPAGGLPVLLAVLGALGMLWTEISWPDALKGFASFAKLLVIPLLLGQFRRSHRGVWAMKGFFVSCVALLAVSLIITAWPDLAWFEGKDRGVPVKDYIAQAGSFVVCVFALAYVAIDRFKARRFYSAIWLLVLATVFLADIFYVAASRTTLVVIPFLLVALGLRQFGWKGVAWVLVGATVLTSLVWQSSPYLRSRVTSLAPEIAAFQQNTRVTSAGLRLYFWQKSLEMIADSPVLGHGTGSIKHTFEKALAGETGIWATPFPNPHNQTFAVGIQVGLVGIAVLFAMWASHLLLFREQGLVAWIGFTIVAQNIISSLFNSHLFDFTQGWIYVFGVGVAGGTVHAIQQQGKTSEWGQAFAGRLKSLPLVLSSAQPQKWLRAWQEVLADKVYPMIQLPRLTTRQLLIVAHDLLATAAAIAASFYIRFETPGVVQRWDGLVVILPAFVLYAGVIYFLFGLYKGKWRFTSMPDVQNIFRVSSVLALSLLMLDYILVTPNFYGTFFFGKITIVLYWFLQMAFLGGPRIAYRYFRYSRTRRDAKLSGSIPVIVVGRAADADVLLRAIESGAAKKIWPIGILSPSAADQGQAVRGLQVLGNFSDLLPIVSNLAKRGTRVDRLILTPSALDPAVKPEALLMQARRLGLATSRLPSLDQGGEALRLAPVAIEDLLLRPSVQIDYQRLEDFIRGKSIIVTGGGGSIGAEICDRVVTFGAARLLIIENSEPALHAVLELLAAKRSKARVDGSLADVRDRDRIFRLLGDFQPDIVFHAAALKHVPLLEKNWEEGIKTNIFGSINVADAAAAVNAGAMVMISTDKAIEPVSVLGATKRFAEMYCQALDAEFSSRSNLDKRPMRIISVRFGNVLASNGSVIPKFKAQIESGGPVTVTHPDMVRYFMTIREACDLVVSAASHALGQKSTDVSIYVLNMGQPVKIVELAERLIRLSGLEPGHDIDIVFTGIRPGERLHEILFAREEPRAEIGISGMVAAKPALVSLAIMRKWIATLEQGLASEDRAAIYCTLREAVPGFQCKGS